MSSISKQLSSIACGGRKPSPSFTDVRLVLLGKTGCGKSSTANSILGRRAFESKVSSSSVTQRCRRASGEFRGRHLTLLDTPGLLDTHQAPHEVQRELRRSISLLYPGPHVVLLVINIGRFSEEEKEALRQIKQAMGSQALRFSVVVFTHGDLLEEGTSVKQCLMDRCRDLDELVAKCGGRYCVFNNQSSKIKEQVSELFALVDTMMQANEGCYYASKNLQHAEEELALELQQELRLLEEREALLKKKQEAALKQWYEKELEVVRQKNMEEIRELKQKQELERQNEEKLARGREEDLRRGLEESNKREKERKTQEVVKVMAIRREEEKKREALQEKLDKASKMLEEHTEQQEEMRRAMEEKMQKDKMENLSKEREREVQHRQEEQMKRDALQKELEKLMQSLEDQSKEEEERRTQMEDMLRHEKEESQRERDRQMETLTAEKRRSEALTQELKLLTVQMEKQTAKEESLKRQLEENLRREREKYHREIAVLKRQCSEKRSDQTINMREKQSVMSAGIGFAQEMGLVGLNAALESVGASCCVQ